jgi:hypothetical protein
MSTRLTNERLAEIEARLKKATEGPYKVNWGGNASPWIETAPGSSTYDEEEGGVWIGEAGSGFPDDSEFLAHSWEDVRDLLAALKDSRESVAYLEMLLKRVKEDARQELRQETRREALPEYNAETVRYSHRWMKSSEGLPEPGTVAVDGYGETVYFDGEHWYDWPYGWKWSQRPLQVNVWCSIPQRVDREEIGEQLGAAVGLLVDAEGREQDERRIREEESGATMFLGTRRRVVRPHFCLDEDDE